jgi:hypothetical protein
MGKAALMKRCKGLYNDLRKALILLRKVNMAYWFVKNNQRWEGNTDYSTIGFAYIMTNMKPLSSWRREAGRYGFIGQTQFGACLLLNDEFKTQNPFTRNNKMSMTAELD